MPVQVRFRFNKLTGEVEEFTVDDQNRQLSEAEHERIAGDVGRMISRRPLLSEVEPLAEPKALAPGETSTLVQESESTPEAEKSSQRLVP